MNNRMKPAALLFLFFLSCCTSSARVVFVCAMKMILLPLALALFSGCATQQPEASQTQYYPAPRTAEEDEAQYNQLTALANEHLPPPTNQERELAEIRREQEQIKREQGWQELEIDRLKQQEWNSQWAPELNLGR
jgi:hypothetical protein